MSADSDPGAVAGAVPTAGVAAADRLVDLAGRLQHTRTAGFGVDFVSWGFYHPSRWRNYWHTHSFYEVCLGYAGSGEFQAADRSYPVGAGTVFIARPGDEHQIIGSSGRGLGIAFWGFTLTPGRGADPTAPGWWTGLTDSDRPLVSARLGRLPAIIAGLAAEMDRPRSGQQEVLQSLGAALVVETARAFASEEDLAIDSHPGDRPSALVATIQRYLRDNLSRPLSVRDIASQVHLSERHAARLYAAQTGEPLMAALRRLRLERAAAMLLEGDRSVTEIARRCGYPRLRPFSTAFGRHYGQSPGRFRRNRGTLHRGVADRHG